MVDIKINSIAKKNTWKWRTLYDILHEGANAPNGTFSTLRFATVRERERRECLVAKTIYFNITKLLRPGNIANGAQHPFESIKFAILSRSSFYIYAFNFRNIERGKEKDRWCRHLYYWLNSSGIFDNFSSKFLFKFVVCQLATFARILVTKYFFHSPWRRKWSQLGALHLLRHFRSVFGPLLCMNFTQFCLVQFNLH